MDHLVLARARLFVFFFRFPRLTLCTVSLIFLSFFLDLLKCSILRWNRAIGIHISSLIFTRLSGQILDMFIIFHFLGDTSGY